MTIYFSSAKIPILHAYNLTQRNYFLALAANKFSTPEKLLLNLIKLVLLIPPFLFLANLKIMALACSIFISLICYTLILRPIMLYFSLKHLDKIVQKHQLAQEDQ